MKGRDLGVRMGVNGSVLPPRRSVVSAPIASSKSFLLTLGDEPEHERARRSATVMPGGSGVLFGPSLAARKTRT
jgi:hypothetical protein